MNRKHPRADCRVRAKALTICGTKTTVLTRKKKRLEA